MGRIVLETAVCGRIVRRGYDYAVTLLLLLLVMCKYGMGDNRSGGVSKIFGNTDVNAVCRKDLKCGKLCRP